MNITKEQAKKHLSNLIDNLLDSEETHYSEHFNIDYEQVDLTATEDLQEHNYKDLRVLQDYLNQDDYEEKAKREEFNYSDIAIYDYMQGLNFFYKIEVPIDEDVDEWVDNLMTLKGHKHNSCSWSGMSLDDIVDETHTIITHQELKAMEDK